MRTLVCGAGVIGSLYAARLAAAGAEVALLARGHRLQFLSENGVALESAYTGARTVQEVPVVDRFDDALSWDLVVVAVRKNQVAALLPELARVKSPTILFLGNNVRGPAELVEALGPGRVLLGFPGAGGIIEEETVVYVDSDERGAERWGLVIGEIDGSLSQRLTEIQALFSTASVPVEIVSDMKARLVSQAGVSLPIASALYLVEGGALELSGRPDILRLLIAAIRESFAVQEALGISILPRQLLMYRWVPSWILNTMMRARFATRMAEIGIQGHSLAAQDEVETLVGEYRELLKKTTVRTPALNTLYNLHDGS